MPARIVITPLQAPGAEVIEIESSGQVWLPVGRYRFTAIGDDGSTRTIERTFVAGDDEAVIIELDD